HLASTTAKPLCSIRVACMRPLTSDRQGRMRGSSLLPLFPAATPVPDPRKHSKASLLRPHSGRPESCRLERRKSMSPCPGARVAAAGHGGRPHPKGKCCYLRNLPESIRPSKRQPPAEKAPGLSKVKSRRGPRPGPTERCLAPFG